VNFFETVAGFQTLLLFLFTRNEKGKVNGNSKNVKTSTNVQKAKE